MKWKFCEFCYINGHCENQDRGHKCECYGKKLEDKCERLEKQLKIAVEGLKDVIETVKTGFVVCDACGFQGECRDCAAQIVAEQTLDELKELKQDDKIPE